MKIIMLGSLGNINRHSIPRLIDDGHDVAVVTSSNDRVPDITALGAEALVGSMTDAGFLSAALRGSDVAYLMISGAPQGDLMAATAKQAEIFATAILASGVKNVVLLSSIGAQNPESGILYHTIENALSALDIQLAIIRPVGFYSNLFGDMATIKSAGTIFSNIPADVTRFWVDPSDIAELQYQFLTKMPANKTIKYVISDRFTANDWLAALSAENISVSYQEIPDAAVKDNLMKAGFSESNAEQFMKMSAAQRDPETFYADIEHKGFYQGKVKLADFAKVFAAAYKAN